MAFISRHAWPIVIIRSAFCGVAFILGCIAIRFTQGLGWLFVGNQPKYYHTLINITKTQFVILLSFYTSIINPCKVSITYDPSKLPKSNSFRVDPLGHLISSLSPNSVWMSNHQIYTDWLYLWFLTYTGHFSDSVYIVLKAALANVPILGKGMLNYKFLFLLRKWDSDKPILTNKLLEIGADARGKGPASGVKRVASSNNSNPEINTWPGGSAKSHELWPYQMIIFPEGTVPSANTKERSAKYADKVGRQPFKHTLLPRVRGLFLMLRSLRDTVETVYDVTTGYSGLKANEYGEEVFSLKRFYIKGYGPPKINFHIRSFNVKDIPLGDDDIVDIDEVPESIQKAFEEWVYKVWLEKDELMKKFYETGSFETVSPGTKTVVADFKIRTWVQAVLVYTPLATFLLLFAYTIRLLVLFYA